MAKDEPTVKKTLEERMIEAMGFEVEAVEALSETYS